jgi:hypothetical protein
LQGGGLLAGDQLEYTVIEKQQAERQVEGATGLGRPRAPGG